MESALSNQIDLSCIPLQWANKKNEVEVEILHNHCFQFLLGNTVVPREIEDNGYAFFFFFFFLEGGGGGGCGGVHYGLCENGEILQLQMEMRLKLTLFSSSPFM